MGFSAAGDMLVLFEALREARCTIAAVKRQHLLNRVSWELAQSRRVEALLSAPAQLSCSPEAWPCLGRQLRLFRGLPSNSHRSKCKVTPQPCAPSATRLAAGLPGRAPRLGRLAPAAGLWRARTFSLHTSVLRPCMPGKKQGCFPSSTPLSRQSKANASGMQAGAAAAGPFPSP